jgi:hypothetical protein
MMTGSGPSGQVLPARASLRLCLALASCWALPGTLIGGYAVARYRTIPPGARTLPGAVLPASSFISFLVLLSAAVLLAPLIFAGLAYLGDALRPATWGWRAAWLGAVAAGAAVEAGWIGPANQQAVQDVSPQTVPPWSLLIMFLGHLVVGAAMIVILRAAARSRA